MGVPGRTPNPIAKGPVVNGSSSSPWNTPLHEPYVPQNMVKNFTMGPQAKKRVREEQCAHSSTPKKIIPERLIRKGVLRPLVPRSPPSPPPSRRVFDKLGMPLTVALETLVKKGYLSR